MVDFCRRELQLMEARIETLKKIRQLKQSSDTVKKIHKHGFRKGPYVESQGKNLRNLDC